MFPLLLRSLMIHKLSFCNVVQVYTTCACDLSIPGVCCRVDSRQTCYKTRVSHLERNF